MWLSLRKKTREPSTTWCIKNGKNGPSYIKRLYVTSITRDKMYDWTTEIPNSERALIFPENPTWRKRKSSYGKLLTTSGKVSELKWDLDFPMSLIKGRQILRVIFYKICGEGIELNRKRSSTLKPRKIWFDEVVGRRLKCRRQRENCLGWV